MYGKETAERQYSEYSDFFFFFLHNENQSTMRTQTDIGENPPKSDGVDETEDVSRNQVWDIPRTVIRSGGRQMEIVKQKADQWVIGYLR